MRNRRFSTYIYWGITALLVIGVCVLLVFAMIHMDKIKQGGKILTGILMPIIYGAVLAYLLAPLYNRTRKATERILEKFIHAKKTQSRAGKAVATVVSLAALFAVVIGLLSILIPQLVDSVQTLLASLPTSLNNLENWLREVLADNPELSDSATEWFSELSLLLESWVNANIMPDLANFNENIQNIIPNVGAVVSRISSGVMGVVTVLKNVLIGVIVMVYLLNIKDTFCAQAKKATYGLLPLNLANRVIREIRYIHEVFGGFIIGKLLDSLIIGILCFLCLSVMNMPYVMLVSVIVGVTNVIPFFGPFIGAIPSAFFILLVSPMKCLYFIIFIFLLQQFDGNILGPKILGNSTGISSFWVLFSILLFGGLFGFVGMIIGVPTFAVLYNLAKEGIEYFLRKKELSCNTQDYDGLDYIEKEQKTYVRKQEE